MLDAVRDLGRYSVYATDGHVGSVSDLYFDDESWRVHYLVVKAGGSISNRKVLVSPGFVSGVDAGTMTLYADLTTEQVQNSSGIETARPVDAQWEADYYAYYGTVPYWSAGFAPDLTGAAYTDAFQAQPRDAEKTSPVEAGTIRTCGASEKSRATVSGAWTVRSGTSRTSPWM